MSSAAPTSSTAANQNGKRKSAKRKRTNRSKVTCLICNKQFASITASHLRTHGFTLTRYRRAYDAPTRASRGSSGHLDDPTALATDRQTVTTIARRIVEDPQVIRDLAGEVAEAIFSTSLRDQLRVALVALVTERLKSHGHAVAALDRIRAEATQPWRIEQGGENGAPTPTKDLVALASVLGQEVKQGEELLLKTVKLAVEEYRSNKGSGTIEGGLPDRFTGSGEVLPVPPELTSQDRETIRTLWGMFDRAITTRRTVIDVTAEAGTIDVVPGRPAEDEPERSAVQVPAEDDPLPVQVPAAGDPTSPAPGEGHSPEAPLNAPTPRVGPDEPF